jgi:hypothetical protein
MNQKTFTKYLEAIALLPAEPDFEGVRWVTEITEPMWNAGSAPEDWADSYQPIVKLLFDIGFVGIFDGGRIHFSHDAPAHADAAKNLSPTARYIIHPAFHTTLGLRHRRPRPTSIT